MPRKKMGLVERFEWNARNAVQSIARGASAYEGSRRSENATIRAWVPTHRPTSILSRVRVGYGIGSGTRCLSGAFYSPLSWSR